MPALTFTSVDHTVDELTITAHGLVTGDGPVGPRNTGGALPAPLDPLADYWFIRTGANTGKLATSSANALLGTAVALTTNGTGTNVLEYGIPFRRARTYVASSVSVAGSQLKSADLNAAMDALKALHFFQTGLSQTLWTPVAQFAIGHMGFVGTDGTAAAIAWTSGGYAKLTSAGNFYADLKIQPGTRISKVDFSYDRQGSGSITPRVQRINLATGAIDSVIAGSADAASSGIQLVTLAANHIVVPGYAYHLAVTATHVDNRLHAAELRA